MALSRREWKWWVLAGLMLALPIVLLGNALILLRELETARRAYLQNQAAALATRLETIPEDRLNEELAGVLAEEFPSLVDIRLFRRSDTDQDEALASIWRGERLFRIKESSGAGWALFRVYVPFHGAGELRIAKLDLAPESADFLTERSQRNLYLAIATTMALVGLTAWALWARRRQEVLEAQQQRLEWLAELGQLSAVLAHEIRNPLGSVKGFVQLAAEKASDDLRTLLDASLEQIARLERLVRDLLLYARVPRPEIQRVAWREIEARLKAQQPLVEYRGGDFELDTDAALLEQALVNLIRNARDAGTHVIVEAGEGSIRVTDDGPGLPGEVRKNLFQPFLTTKAQGTGLGLATSKNLIEALGGRLTLRDAAGRGTQAEIQWNPTR